MSRITDWGTDWGNIREKRNESICREFARGQTRRQLSERWGLTRQQISNILRADMKPEAKEEAGE